MYTPGAAWLQAFEGDAITPVIRALLTRTFGTVLATLHSGDRRYLLGPESMPLIAGLKPIAQKLDLFTRQITISDWTTELVDVAGELSTLFAANWLKGARLQLYVGEAGLAESAYEPIHDMLVVQEVPRPEGGGKLVLAGQDPFSFGLDEERDAYWRPGHPLAVIRDQLLAAVPAASLGHSSLLELSYTDIGHFVVSRHPYNYSVAWDVRPVYLGQQRVRGDQMIRELLWLIRGALLPGTYRSNGQIRYVPYDPNATAVRHFTSHDVMGVRQLEDGPVINRTWISGHCRSTTIDAVAPEAVKMVYLYDEVTAAQAAAAFPSSATPPPKVYEADEELYSPWINGVGLPLAQYPGGPASMVPNASPGAGMTLFAPHYYGFAGTSLTDGSGNRLAPPTSTIQTNHQLSASRPAYFLITNHQGVHEFVRAEAFAYNTANGSISLDSPIGFQSFWRFGTFTLTARGIWGSTARDWTTIVNPTAPVFVYDLTIPQWIASRIRDRHPYGVPQVEFLIPFKFWGLELGDLVSFDAPPEDVTIRGHAGVDSTVIWEVLSVEEGWLEDTPGLKVTAAFMRDAPIVPGEADPPDFGGDVPTGTVGEYYYDASGEIYVDASGEAYTNY